MKTKVKIFMICLFMINNLKGIAQSSDYSGFQITPRIGNDFPTYKNQTPYIDYKGGIDLGLSIDYYWTWFGLGLDIDYISNKPKSIYPTTNLYAPGGTTPITSFSLSENEIKRFFYGFGPNFQHVSPSGRFKTELNTRFGLASIKGGRTYLEGTSASNTTYGLNFHAGYDIKNAFTYKGQIRSTYFFNPNFGIHLGAYYMHHFKATELIDPTLNSAAGHRPFTSQQGNSGQINALDDVPVIRSEPCDCDIYSVGVFAGITLKFNKKQNKCPVCKEDHSPHCCTTCGCSVTITAKDKFTGDILPDTDIVLTDLNGNIVHSGKTNSYGVAVFKEVVEDHYLIRGKLYNVTLEEGRIEKEEFKNCKKTLSGIQKVMLYADENFILKGRVVECNTSKGIDNVDIILKNKIQSGQKNTLSNTAGNFVFHLKQSSTFTLKGNKDGYFSNEVEISTNGEDRNTTLFINFEMCVNPCGKAIVLDNINFDLDKSEILPSALPDLNRVVRIMRDNPKIKVEMSSHTDSQGSDSYNLALSQRRADATVSYLISQGISMNRLIARGAGETELLNTKCKNGIPCTDVEHRINRRTEFKVVCD